MITDMFKGKLAEDKLLNYVRLTFLLSIIGLFANGCNRTIHYFIKEADGLSADASKRDFCAMALTQMIHKKLSKKIISDGLYELIVADNYKNMFFDDEDNVSAIFTGENSCRALVKTKDGLRSFDLFLEEGDDPEFHYQISKIHENELYEKQS